MYKRICGLIFALLISVSCFADFSVLMERFVNDSTGLDSSAYVETLIHMYENERQNRDIYIDKANASGQAECEYQMKLIRAEVLKMAQLSPAEIDSVEAVIESEGLNGLELGALLSVIGAGVVGIGVAIKDKIKALWNRFF